MQPSRSNSHAPSVTRNITIAHNTSNIEDSEKNGAAGFELTMTCHDIQVKPASTTNRSQKPYQTFLSAIFCVPIVEHVVFATQVHAAALSAVLAPNLPAFESKHHVRAPARQKGPPHAPLNPDARATNKQ